MGKFTILGIQINNRTSHANEVQAILTEYGCNIKTRLGLHNVDSNSCSPNGLIILEMYGDEKRIIEAENKLKAVSGISVKKMVFEE